MVYIFEKIKLGTNTEYIVLIRLMRDYLRLSIFKSKPFNSLCILSIPRIVEIINRL